MVGAAGGHWAIMFMGFLRHANQLIKAARGSDCTAQPCASSAAMRVWPQKSGLCNQTGLHPARSIHKALLFKEHHDAFIGSHNAPERPLLLKIAENHRKPRHPNWHF